MDRVFDYVREMLKLTAIFAMTVDHIGAILYPHLLLLRVIGRLSFPIFAYLLMLGIEDTRRIDNYFLSIFLFALVSQIPYSLAFGIDFFNRLNILFTLFLSGLALHFFNRKSVLIIIPLVSVISMNFEGGIYAIAAVASMKILKEWPKLGIISLLFLNIPFVFVQDIQAFSLLSLPLILSHSSGYLKKNVRIPIFSFYHLLRKYFYYLYYPLHLASLYLL